VSDFDPFGDKKVLDILLSELKKSDTFAKFFSVFMTIYKTKSSAMRLKAIWTLKAA